MTEQEPVESKGDANALETLQGSGGSSDAEELGHNFKSDVVVYGVERAKADLRRPQNVYVKRYLDRDIRFKVFLYINTDGHLGKYVATLTSATRRLRGLDDARDGGHANL